MKYTLLALWAFAAPVQAESLCGAIDVDSVLGALAGEWVMQGATSVEGT